tara:strand:- start:17 stop:436 length:420 start_codon:yes stop_codon:yes gene_type:complete
MDPYTRGKKHVIVHEHHAPALHTETATKKRKVGAFAWDDGEDVPLHVSISAPEPVTLSASIPPPILPAAESEPAQPAPTAAPAALPPPPKFAAIRTTMTDAPDTEENPFLVDLPAELPPPPAPTKVVKVTKRAGGGKKE